MKMKIGGNFIKAKEVKPRSTITFLDEGEWVESEKYTYEDGKPQMQCIFKVKYEKEEKQYRMNKASRVAMIEAFGDESKDWIGKQAMIHVMPTPNGNDKMILLSPVNEKDKTPEAWDE